MLPDVQSMVVVTVTSGILKGKSLIYLVSDCLQRPNSASIDHLLRQEECRIVLLVTAKPSG